MKTKIILIFSFLLLAVSIMANNKDYLVPLDLSKISTSEKIYLDSILSFYKSSNNDTLKLNTLNDLIKNVENLDVKYIYNEFFLKQNNLYFSNQSETLDNNGHQLYTALYYGNKGVYYAYKTQIDSSLTQFHLSEQLLLPINKPRVLASIYGNIAYCYSEKSQQKRSIDYVDKAITIFKELKDYKNLALNYINIGVTFFELEEDKKALQFINEGYDYALKANSNHYESYALRTKASILFKQKRYKECIETSTKALDILNNLGSKRRKANVFILLASSYQKLKQIEKAEDYIVKTLAIANELGMIHFKALALIKRGNIEFDKNNINKARTYALQAFEISKLEPDYSNKVQVTELLSAINAYEKNYKKAYQFKVLNVLYSDSLSTLKNKASVIKQGVKYDYQKQKEVDDLNAKKKIEIIKQEKRLVEADKKRTQTIMFSATLIALLVIIAALFIYSRLKIIRKQKVELDRAYEQLEESKKKELIVSNLKALQSQMNPHFIFNALNSVQDLVLIKDVRNSNRFLGKFSDLIRKILTSSRKQFITLDEELEILGLYLDLEKLRFGDEFIIDFKHNVMENTQSEIEIPAMFIQPYVENAIKHGLFNKEGVKKLRVEFTLENGYLKCEIEDNGVGQEMSEIFKQQNLHTHTGFSTESINQRIFLLNQTLSKEIKYKIEDLKNGDIALGTKVTLQFPV